ncbi:lipopolysaccharide biosynthesis protein [Aureimonas pseudogalii]|uniref:O-antigen/teichoic acid export membrane protein n=1 Tax=Aureimonas pseudogalii TaxID=1744844 RepID=A0A7W6H570_9HYPH|nr:lipopolysaccharide biosynthesis protein [Aureimonas pseudogalii]MBB3998782.1 O-antigen/teichoic acid export membrane protein [Aureimonas pseudogalii]
MTLTLLADRAADWARRPAIRGIVGVVLLKAGIIAFNFALIFLAARLLGAHDFGTYSLLFSAAGLCCVAATFGQQMLVMRSWSEYGATRDAGLLKGALFFSTAVCGMGALLVGLGFVAVVGDVGSAVWPVAAYAVLLTLVLYTSHLVRSAVGVGRGDGYANIAASLPPVAFLAFCWWSGGRADLLWTFTFFAAGLAIALVVHMASMQRVLSARPGFGSAAPQLDLRSWAPRSWKLWLSSMLEAANQYLDVLLIGWLLSPSVAGAYFVTTRLANAFATASDALNMFSTRHIPDLHFRKDRAALASLLNSVAAMTALMIAVGLLGLVVGGRWLLAAFNPDYADYYQALIVLSVGTAAAAAAGPSASVLMLTGHEGRYLAIMALSIALRAAGFLALIPSFGLMGAVFATALSFTITAWLLAQSSRTLACMDCSVTRLAHPRTL